MVMHRTGCALSRKPAPTTPTCVGRLRIKPISVSSGFPQGHRNLLHRFSPILYPSPDVHHGKASRSGVNLEVLLFLGYSCKAASRFCLSFRLKYGIDPCYVMCPCPVQAEYYDESRAIFRITGFCMSVSCLCLLLFMTGSLVCSSMAASAKRPR